MSVNNMLKAIVTLGKDIKILKKAFVGMIILNLITIILALSALTVALNKIVKPVYAPIVTEEQVEEPMEGDIVPLPMDLPVIE